MSKKEHEQMDMTEIMDKLTDAAQEVIRWSMHMAKKINERPESIGEFNGRRTSGLEVLAVALTTIDQVHTALAEKSGGWDSATGVKFDGADNEQPTFDTDFIDQVITIPPMDNDSLSRIARQITDDTGLQEVLVTMSSGNIGAMTAMNQMFAVDHARAAYALHSLAKWDIVGPLVWLLFKDVCRQDANAMLIMIEKEEAQDALAALPYSHYRKES
jgi:hypothetical protein